MTPAGPDDGAASASDRMRRRATTFRAGFRNGAYLGGAKAFYLLIRLVYIVALVSIIGVEHYGYLSYAQNWHVLLIPLAAWGSSEVAISHLARGSSDESDRLMGSGLVLRMLFGLIAVAAICAAALLIESNTGLRALMLVYSQGVLVRSLGGWYAALFTAFAATQYWLRLSVAFTTLEVAATLLLANAGVELVTLAAVHCLLWWLSLVTTALVFHRYISPLRIRWDRAVVHVLVTRGAWIGLATFFLGCLLPGLLVLYRLLADDLHRIGEVAIVLQIFQILFQVTLFVGSAALPALSRSQDRSAGHRAFTRFTWNASFFLGGALVTAAMFVLPALLELLPRGRFHPSLDAFARCSWIVLPLFMLHGFRLLLIAGDRLQRLPLIMAAGVATLTLLVVGLDAGNALTPDHLYLALGLTLMQIALCLAPGIVAVARPSRSMVIAPLALGAILGLAAGSPDTLQVYVALSGTILLSILGALEIRRLAST